MASGRGLPLHRDHLDRLFDLAEAAGLKPCPIMFEVVPSRWLQAASAYGGVMSRHGHWSFGKAYQRIRLAHEYRLTRMYELVVNAEPAVAYLLDSNTEVENLVVVAHVLAHVDFFQQHYRFREVPRDLPDRLAASWRRLEAVREVLGPDRLEQLMDDAGVVAEHLDPYRTDWQEPANVLAFLLHESPVLDDAGRTVLQWADLEARYFRPQLETKIANEGWATYWHQSLLRAYPLSPGQVLEYARLHAAVIGSGGLDNPYRLGLALWQAAFAEDPQGAVRAHRYLGDRGLVDRWLTPDVLRRVAPDLEAEHAPAALNRLRQALDNAGLPRIEVEGQDGSVLLLRHRHDGRDLDTRRLPGAMAAVGRLWGGPVRLATVMQGRPRRLLWNGQELEEEVVSG
jgi:stage V sporulation protein R